jgi:DNA-binding transcriptional MerR regulator
MMARKQLTLSSILDSPILSRLVVGIGDAAEITGVSARQLRYWEAKGIISSRGDKDGASRKYDYPNIEKIVLLKDFLDQGYTLEAAARRLEERIRRLNSAIAKLSGKAGAGDGPAETGRPAKIDGHDYVYIGRAVHRPSGRRYEIYSPLGDDREELLAEDPD